MREIRIALSRSGMCTVWRSNTGVDCFRGVRYGLGKGGADLVGFRHRDGRFLGIEVKTSKGRLSPAQRAWLAHVTAHRGIAAVVRSVEEALMIVSEAD